MIKLASVFSGIGAVEHALERLKNEKDIDYEIVFACDNGERELSKSIDEIEDTIKELDYEEKKSYINELYEQTKKPNYVKMSYFENYDIDENEWYEDIRFIDGSKYQGNVNLLVGGSPCQSFSNMGKRKGLVDERGILVFQFIRLINEIQPNVFIFENVPGMLSHNKGRTWEKIKDKFDSLDYDIHIDILNSKDYGIPQDRRRLFVVGFKKKVENFKFPEKQELNTKLSDFLEDKVDYIHYLGRKGFEFVTNPNNSNRARINSEIMKTQKANQQYNWNGDFIFEKYDPNKHDKKIKKRAYLGEYEGKQGVVRQLTNRECLRLMGFSDNFNIVVPRMQAYRQAGNSIVVNVLQELMKSILEVVDFNE